MDPPLLRVVRTTQSGFGRYRIVGDTVVDPQRAAEFAEITGADPLTAQASPLFGVCLARAGFIDALATALPPDIGESIPVLHGEHVQRSYRPLVIHDHIRVSAAALARTQRSSGSVVVVRVRLSCGDVPVEEHDLTAFLPGANLGPPAGTAVQPVAELQPSAATAFERLEIATASDLSRRYGIVADDTSPFHMDDHEARRYGFPGVILHGLCTLTLTVNALLAQTGSNAQPALIAARFVRPGRPGEPLRVDYARRAQDISFRCVGPTGDELLRHGLVQLA